MVGDIKSERWARSFRKGGRHRAESAGKLEPLDARLLALIYEMGQATKKNVPFTDLAERTGRRIATIRISAGHLAKQECIVVRENAMVLCSDYGKELLIATRP
ncbi:hypothetical protein [Bradyrhizobium sp. AZCC 2230]|uniref:hypothetical protein n=1 Tax=Bradyrhizobium sp. AZCC 2230 TaxID=3117021 RepID=UPI002FEFF3B8